MSEDISEWNCPKCKSAQFAKKELVPYRFPPLLIIHLKRFQINMLNGNWMKCSKKIQVSDQLTFQPDGTNGRNKFVYRLYAAIIHQVETTPSYPIQFDQQLNQIRVRMAKI